MVKIGIVGTGLIGKTCIECIKHIDDFELVCLCDVNEEVVSKMAEECGVPYFLDYKEIPKKVELDAIILNLPHFLHCEASVFFLEAGINVFIEKPMANTVEECNIMMEAEKKSGKKLCVGHIQRYYSANRKIREIIQSGVIGKFCMATEQRSVFYFADWRPRWFLDKEKSGGGITMNFGAHALDKYYYITGKAPVDAISNFDNFKNDFTVEGHSQFLAKFEDGTTASITFSAYNNVVYDDVYYCTDGAIRCIDNVHMELYRPDKPTEKFDVVDDILPLEIELRDFLNCLLGKPNEMPDGEYSRAIISTIRKALSNRF